MFHKPFGAPRSEFQNHLIITPYYIIKVGMLLEMLFRVKNRIKWNYIFLYTIRFRQPYASIQFLSKIHFFAKKLFSIFNTHFKYLFEDIFKYCLYIKP